MGWDISLDYLDERETTVESHCAGSQFAIGGSDEAEMCLTYNYSAYYFEHVDPKKGLRWINGKTAAETLPVLRNAVANLSDEGSHLNDYWASTPYNAKLGLQTLISWAEQHPEAVWSIT